jgi:predicted  nucleic acid-binding Zn-ribbon protein
VYVDEQMRNLVDLQKADLRLKEIERLREDLPRKMEQITEEIENERQRYKETQDRLEEVKQDRRKKERDLEVEVERVKKSQRRLFEVKTNKEYQALLKEIEAAKEANLALEEEILDLMEAMDEAERTLSGQERELHRIEEERSAEREKLQRQLDGLAGSLQDWLGQRERAAARLDPATLAQYDRIAQRNSGLGVVPVNGGTCQGCHMSIPPQLYNEILKSGSVVQCPFCTRFIYCEAE